MNKLQIIANAINNNGAYDFEVKVNTTDNNVQCNIYCDDVYWTYVILERVNNLGFSVKVWLDKSRMYFAPND